MNDEQYLQHCRAQLTEFAETLVIRTRHLPEEDTLRQLAESFQAMSADGTALHEECPLLVTRLFTTYPDFAPGFPRDLLWFFGGDCLHYMPDSEIAIFQQLDDMRAEADARGEVLDLREARASLLQLQ
jgi:hypothetical protein